MRGRSCVVLPQHQLHRMLRVTKRPTCITELKKHVLPRFTCEPILGRKPEASFIRGIVIPHHSSTSSFPVIVPDPSAWLGWNERRLLVRLVNCSADARRLPFAPSFLPSSAALLSSLRTDRPRPHETATVQAPPEATHAPHWKMQEASRCR